MGQIYLAINYGTEGWCLTPQSSATKALENAKLGIQSEWKIMKELDISINDGGINEKVIENGI